jgi:hypothetical protein
MALAAHNHETPPEHTLQTAFYGADHASQHAKAQTCQTTTSMAPHMANVPYLWYEPTPAVAGVVHP